MLTLILLIMLATWIAGAVYQLPGVARREAFEFEEKRQKALQWQADRMTSYNNAYDRWESLPTHRRGDPPKRPVEIIGQLEAERKWEVAGDIFKTLLWPAAPFKLAGHGTAKVWNSWALEGVINYQNASTRLAIENPKPNLRTKYNALADAVSQVIAKLPAVVQAELQDIDEQLQTLVDHVTDINDTLVLSNIMDEYVMDTLNTYLDCSDDTRNSPSVVHALVSQLSTIARPLERMTGNVGKTQIDAFKTNGLFLNDKFPTPVPSQLEL